MQQSIHVVLDSAVVLDHSSFHPGSSQACDLLRGIIVRLGAHFTHSTLKQVPEFGAAEVLAQQANTLGSLLAYLLEVRRVLRRAVARH